MERPAECGGNWRKAGCVRFPVGRWEMTFSRALLREINGRREFALAYDGTGPFPLPDLFCFARFASIDGRCHIIYAFDEKNTPIF